MASSGPGGAEAGGDLGENEHRGGVAGRVGVGLLGGHGLDVAPVADARDVQRLGAGVARPLEHRHRVTRTAGVTEHDHAVGRVDRSPVGRDVGGM
jgi:hypothetical protein